MLLILSPFPLFNSADRWTVHRKEIKPPHERKKERKKIKENLKPNQGILTRKEILLFSYPIHQAASAAAVVHLVLLQRCIVCPFSWTELESLLKIPQGFLLLFCSNAATVEVAVAAAAAAAAR